MALGVDGLRVGSWTHPAGHTGTTVLLPPEGSVGGVAVRGAAPGTREAAALGPYGKVDVCHGVVLSGGSAFGLATADGVVEWLAERDVGYQAMTVRVPIVGAAIVFDIADAAAGRPGAAEGRAACDAVTADDPPMGRVGVGAGCTVGKTAGYEWHVPGGQGWAVERAAGVRVGALMAVNAFGDVIDERGAVLAGSTAPPGTPRFPEVAPPHRAAVEHTVIGCVVTDAALDKQQVCRVADLAHTGVARAVDPPHTTFDGDALFCVATGAVHAPHPDLVVHLAGRAVAAAIRAAVRA